MQSNVVDSDDGYDVGAAMCNFSLCHSWCPFGFLHELQFVTLLLVLVVFVLICFEVRAIELRVERYELTVATQPDTKHHIINELQPNG